MEIICKAFGITLSQFFAETDMVELTPELKALFDGWVSLTPEQKDAVQKMIGVMNNQYNYVVPTYNKRLNAIQSSR